ncbi:MAG: carbohydrate ABC transporter permease [Bacillota bacterium]
MRRKRLSRLLGDIVAWTIALVWIIPFLGILMTAVRPLSEIIHGWWRLESLSPTLQNFVGAWNHPAAPLSHGMQNSLKVALPATALPILVAAAAAYGFARFSFRMRTYLFLTIVMLMTIPQQMIAVPIFRIMKSLGLVDTPLGLVLVHCAWGIPWLLYFLRNFFTTLPLEVEEAARVDGASDLRVFLQIVLPMSIPAIVSSAVLQFMWVWNDFFLALILIYSPQKLLVTQRIPLLRGVYHIDWGVLSAGAIIVMLVPVLIFVFLQRYYVKGMVGWVSK